MCHETESTRQLSWSTGWCILWWSPWLCWRFQTFCNCVLIWMMEKWASKDHDSRCKIFQNTNVQINDIYAILIYPALYIYIELYIHSISEREMCQKETWLLRHMSRNCRYFVGVRQFYTEGWCLVAGMSWAKQVKEKSGPKGSKITCAIPKAQGHDSCGLSLTL